MNDDWKTCQHEFEPYVIGMGEGRVARFRMSKCKKCEAIYSKRWIDGEGIEEDIRPPHEKVVDAEFRKSIAIEKQ